MNVAYLQIAILFTIGMMSPLTGWTQSNNGDPLSTEQARMVAKEVVNEAAQQKFAGLDFGVGVSLTIDTGNNDRVKSAEIVDGVVRITKENNATARIMLESHYFFTPDSTFFGLIQTNRLEGNRSQVDPNKTFGIGPFIALQPGTDEIIEAVGAGLMIGFRRKPPATGSWNFGIGYVVDPNVQVLGDGFEGNRPPPGAETQVRYKETNQQGVMLIASFAF